MPRRIQLACGKKILVDDEDYPRVLQHGWGYTRKHGHISGTIGNKTTLLHYFILGRQPCEGQKVIHINFDLLDFRRKNLAIVSHNLACQRQPPKKWGSSRYKGVTWHKKGRKWTAALTIDAKPLHLGCYDTEEEAATAYDKAAREHYGPYARLNFPDP